MDGLFMFRLSYVPAYLRSGLPIFNSFATYLAYRRRRRHRHRQRHRHCHRHRPPPVQAEHLSFSFM